jgi:hypothetical protein
MTVPQLVASVARVSALSGAPRDVVMTLADSCRAQLEVFCASNGSRLVINDYVLHLFDAGRTAFSGMVGAGVADLYLTDLGYVYRCNAREWAKGGKVADFVYDGPPTRGAGVVLAEAKGSVSSRTTPQSIRTDTRRGYREQVVKHIGRELAGALVLHGYAIGFGAQPGAGNSFGHVVETGRAQKQPRYLLLDGLSDALPQSGPGASVWVDANRRVALENFRAIFLLLGSTAAIHAIDAGTREDISETLRRLPDELVIRTWRGNPYVVARNAPAHGDARGGHFGLREEVARVLFQEILGRRASSGQIHLPYWPAAQAVSALASEGAAFPDGFAYFRTEDPSAANNGAPWKPPLQDAKSRRRHTE